MFASALDRPFAPGPRPDSPRPTDELRVQMEQRMAEHMKQRAEHLRERANKLDTYAADGKVTAEERADLRADRDTAKQLHQAKREQWQERKGEIKQNRMQRKESRPAS